MISMNFLDVILIVLILVIFVGALILCVMAAKDDEVGAGIGILIFGIVISFLGIWSCFLVTDRGSGSTIGEITSVDKNFFGTTALYVKTSETTQEKYCIENNKVVEQAKELIGKKVKISYGERVGLYSTGDCNQAPVVKIEEV